MYKWGTLVLTAAICFGLVSQALASGPSPIWQFSTEAQIWSSPTESHGTIFLGSDDGCLYALEATGGKKIWKFKTAGRVRSKPFVMAESVFFSSDDGFLYCLNRSDGSLRWRFDLECGDIPRNLPSLSPPYHYDYLQSSPLVTGDTVFIGSASSYVYAVDVDSGKEKWRFQTGGLVRSSPRLNGDAIVIGSWDHHVYCLDGETGGEVWRTDTGGIVQATPVVAGGRVYVGSRNPVMVALDASNGEQIWRHVYQDGSWVESSAVVRDGMVYVGSSDALMLTGFDAETGDLKQTCKTGGWSWCTPAVTDQTLFIGGISAEPYYMPGVTLKRGLWAFDRQTGQVRWHLPTERIEGYVTGGVMATPVVSEGVAYFGALDGKVYAVKAGAPGQTEQRVTISSEGWELVGDLVIPDGEGLSPAVLLLNQAGGNRSPYNELATLLAERGIASLRLDLRGHGESTNLGSFLPGDESSIPFPWETEPDVAAAYTALKANPAVDPDRIAMVGASYSGEVIAQAGRAGGYCQAYAALSPGSFSEESIKAIDPAGIPWLIVVAQEDRYLTEITAALQEISETVDLKLIAGSKHGTNILAHHPAVVEQLVDWLAAQLSD
ncbi:MAG: alpha/beta fold hydrolase [bacterium]|nr:alpha/beta fold hydrolase [bacterium]